MKNSFENICSYLVILSKPKKIVYIIKKHEIYTYDHLIVLTS